MFKKAKFFTALILGLCSLGWIYHLMHLSMDDIKKSKAIKITAKAAKGITPEKTHQQRTKVRKDLWLSQSDRTRLHYRIDCKSSLLTLVPIDDKLDIIENLQELQCWMQDKIYNDTTPMQQVRYFQADAGTYQYSLQKFGANTVVLSLFRLPGTDLPTGPFPNTAFLKGIAKDVSFSLAGKATQFQAQQFKASLLTQEVSP